MQELIERLADILECDPAELTEHSIFRDHGHWDSLAVLSTLVMIDEHYQILVPHSDLGKMKTVGDLMRYIAERQSD